MPGFIVHQGATVICSHAAPAQPVAPYPRVQVSGQPISTLVTQYVVSGCVAKPPCVTGQWVVGATRVLAGGAPVVLFDSQGITNAGTMQVMVTQVRAKGT